MRPFSLEQAMNYITQDTDKNIDTDNTSLMGSISASYLELRCAFGTPERLTDGKVRAKWTVKFHDGQVATIYDWKKDAALFAVSDWNVGGMTPAVLDRIKIAIDLAKEKQSEDSKRKANDPIVKALLENDERRSEMLESIAAVEGEGFLGLVKVCTHARKLTELQSILLMGLEHGHKLPTAATNALGDVASTMLCNILGAYATAVGVTDKQKISEAIKWADRLVEGDDQTGEKLAKVLFGRGE